ncbi:MAG TPA: flagellar basal body P-ring formation chaperone FlgA [Candidatus Polarisedimenticolia bacterium]|nr:flagellar basal body P-ring formation chaperone FlgA [Candidatus Polarisedimenticolia bacterium]
MPKPRLTLPFAFAAALVPAGAGAGSGPAAIPVAGPALSLERAARIAAIAAVSAPDRFTPVVCRIAPPGRLPDGVTGLEPVGVDGPNASGVVRVRLRMLAGTAPVGEASATVRGVVRGPVLVATRPLAGGQPIPAASLAVLEADLTSLLGEPLRAAGETEGLVPRRTLGAGRPLTRQALAPAPVVRRGQEVRLRIESAGLTVTVLGVARSDGAPGELLLAESAVTGAVFRGRVQTDGSLVVVSRVGSGRRR